MSLGHWYLAERDMKLLEALTKVLQARTQPLVTGYDLFLILRGLCRSRELDGERINIRGGALPIDRFPSNLNQLIKSGVLKVDEDFSSNVYKIVGIPDKTADEVCCYIDPFCYISYLSAMQRHGLTNRTPTELHLKSPSKSLWSEYKRKKLLDDYKSGPDEGEAIIPLERIGFPNTVRGRSIVRHTTVYPGYWRQVRGTLSRVSTVGQTFLDMLEKPALCGGMPHVLEVWEEHADTFIEEIIESVEKSHTKLTKIRAGYILQERLGLAKNDPRVEAWSSSAQRGGSQRLDPESAYMDVFSEKWMISINA